MRGACRSPPLLQLVTPAHFRFLIILHSCFPALPPSKTHPDVPGAPQGLGAGRMRGLSLALLPDGCALDPSNDPEWETPQHTLLLGGPELPLHAVYCQGLASSPTHTPKLLELCLK